MRRINRKWLGVAAMGLIAILAGCSGSHDNSMPFIRPGVCIGADCVNIGNDGKLAGAAGYVILAKTGISNTGTSDITGNIGVSPEAAIAITGFSLTDPPTTFSRSSLVHGRVYASDYDPPTPDNLTAAVLSMENAYNNAAGRPAGTGTHLDLGGGTLSGVTLEPGTYTWTTSVNITGNITFAGSANDVWVLQIPGTLTQDSATKILLSGGAHPQNIFWQAAGAVTIGTTAHFEGVILAKTSIALQTGATMNGRAFAQSAVTLDGNTVKAP